MEMTNLTQVQKAAYRDCAGGYFDKFYRYNHKDNGTAYQMAWTEAQKIFHPENITYIEYNSLIN